MWTEIVHLTTQSSSTHNEIYILPSRKENTICIHTRPLTCQEKYSKTCVERTPLINATKQWSFNRGDLSSEEYFTMSDCTTTQSRWSSVAGQSILDWWLASNGLVKSCADTECKTLPSQRGIKLVPNVGNIVYEPGCALVAYSEIWHEYRKF